MKYNVTVVFPDGTKQTYVNVEANEITFSESNKTVWIHTEYTDIRYIGLPYFIQAFKQ